MKKIHHFFYPLFIINFLFSSFPVTNQELLFRQNRSSYTSQTNISSEVEPNTARLELASEIGGQATSIVIQDGIALIGSGNRLEVNDVGSPNNPIRESKTVLFSDKVQDVAVNGNFAYIAATSTGLRIVDISNPSAPEEIGFYVTGNSTYGIAVDSHYAYLADGAGGLQIIDISNPTNPQKISSYSTPTSAYGIELKGNYVYIVDRGQYLRVVNISNPSVPVEVSTYLSSGETYDVTLSGTFAYLSAGAAGLVVLDISTPEMITPRGIFNNTTKATHAFVEGVYAYVADQGCLRIIHISNPDSLSQAGSLCLDSTLGVSNFQFMDIAVISPYAYAVSNEYGLRIIHIANPSALFEISHITPGGIGADMMIVDQFAYLSNGKNGLQIVDITDPNKSQLLGNYTEPYFSTSGIFVQDRYAYILNPPELFILDVSNPKKPFKVSQYNGPFGGDDSQIYVSGNYAYLTSYEGFAIMDISDAYHPIKISSISNPLYSNKGITVVGSYAYLADGYAGIKIIDISNPYSPQLVGTLATSYADDIQVVGNLAYVADSSGGLLIVDISNPSSPQLVGKYNTDVICNHVSIAGQVAYVSNGSKGILLLDISVPGEIRRVGTYQTSGMNTFIEINGEHAFTLDKYAGLSIWSNYPGIEKEISTGGDSLEALDLITYTFQSGTFPQTIKFIHSRQLPVDLSFSTGLTGLGHRFENVAKDINGSPILPNNPFEITVRYNEADIAGIIEDSLGLYFWNGVTWEKELTSNVNPQTRTVVATPNHLGQWAVLGNPIGRNNHAYVANISRNYSIPDIKIDYVEFTQAVQTSSNSVVLVENRPTMVRVYASPGMPNILNHVSLTLSASRDGVQLPDSPVFVPEWAIFPNPSRGTWIHSFNVSLPESWLYGKVTFTLELDRGNAIKELNENNNIATYSFSFNPVPPLKVKIVPINYTDNVTGKYYPGHAEDRMSWRIFSLYPIDDLQITIRQAVNFNGDLSKGSEWERLLDLITSIKKSDGAPSSQVYYGMLPISNPAGDYYQSTYGGMGWIGKRVSIGREDNSFIAPHEIGHNFGREHAPACNPPDPDPRYPYAGGTVGQYGYNVSSNEIYPPEYFDIMGYCGPNHVSDYTYKAFYDDQVNHGQYILGMPAVKSLLIRATIAPDGSLILGNLYPLISSPDEEPVSSAYVAQLLDQDGMILASHHLEVYSTAEEGKRPVSIFQIVPLPSGTVDSLRILKDDLVVDELKFIQNVVFSPKISLEKSETLWTLKWFPADLPALIRYTNDGGTSWTTLGIDVFGGEIFINPNDLAGSDGQFEVILGNTIVLNSPALEMEYVK
jgi:hypothetical protein